MASDITFYNTLLPDAYVGQPYQVGISYYGAASAITAATLTSAPAGLALVQSGSGSEDVGIAINGTPTEGGSFNVEITLTDTSGAATLTLPLLVHVAGVVPSDVYSVAPTDAPSVASSLAIEWPTVTD